MAAHWYIVHALSGFEAKIVQTIKEKAAQYNLTDQFEEITVPTEKVMEVRRGKKTESERKFFPGYILIKMELNDKTWHLVKNIPRVTDFLGANGKPQPMTQAEVDRIFKQVEDGVQTAAAGIVFEVGESVKITDGPFEAFVGNVEEVDSERKRLKLSVSIFGRPTPVDLDFTQVEKAS